MSVVSKFSRNPDIPIHQWLLRRYVKLLEMPLKQFGHGELISVS